MIWTTSITGDGGDKFNIWQTCFGIDGYGNTYRFFQERQKWHEIKRNLQIGDVVLIVDSNSPRNSWPMDIICETIPDCNGLVRQVKVKTATNILIRPVDKLCRILEGDC